MYRKALVNGEFLYFVHAPPQTEHDTRPEKRRPEAPNPNEPMLYASVYYYWWAFLRLNEEYVACCERGGTGKLSRIYRDFGDVRDGQRPSTDEKSAPGKVDEFREWWIERGAELFAEKPAREHIQTFESLPKSHDTSGRVLVSVPLSNNYEAVMHAIRIALKPKFDRFMKAHGHYSRAKFRPKDSYRLSSLHETLKIALAYKQIIGAGKPFKSWDVYDKSALPFDLNPDQFEDANAIKSKIVSRALKTATLLIGNVARGEFPDFSALQNSDFKFHETRPRNSRRT